MVRALALPLLLAAAPVFGGFSSSNQFTNNASSLNSGGGRSNSNSYTLVASLSQGGVEPTLSTNFTNRPGLLPAYFYPGKITDLSVSGCVSSQLDLEWTAPGFDGYAGGTSAFEYQLIISSNPDLSNPLPSPVLPTPGVAGTTERATMGGLTDGVTYYAVMLALSRERIPSPQATPAVNSAGTGVQFSGFTAVTGFRVGVVGWTAPQGRGTCAAVSFRVYRALNEAGPYSPVADVDTINYTDLGVTVGTTYYYQIAALDEFGDEIGRTIADLVWVRTKPPRAPSHIGIKRTDSGIEIEWRAPRRFDFGLAFADYLAPSPDELSGYRIFRATDLFNPDWQVLAVAATDQTSFTDTSAFSPNAIYRIDAINATEVSEISAILDTQSSAFFIPPGTRAALKIPEDQLASLWPQDGEAYRIRPKRITKIRDEDGVLSAIRFDVERGSTSISNFRFNGAGARLRMSLPSNQGGSKENAVSAVKDANARPLDISQTGVYWDDGAKWAKLYGEADTANNWIEAETSYLGSFELRNLARGTEFHFDKRDISNRFLTPNGDGKNDRVVFTFDNPQDSLVTGKIFDTTGALLTTFAQTSRTTAEWNGKANGAVVPPGVYIYQLEGDEKIVTGTLVVVR